MGIARITFLEHLILENIILLGKFNGNIGVIFLCFFRIRELFNYLPLCNKDETPVIKADDPPYVHHNSTIYSRTDCAENCPC